MIGISSCLLGVCCRYDGVGLQAPFIKQLKEKPLLLLCPEMLAGFPSPRPPCEIEGGDGNSLLLGKGRIVTAQGEDITKQMIKGAQRAVELCVLNSITTVYLQNRSPSCGCGQIYNGTFCGQIVKGDGVFTALLKQKGIKTIAVEGIKIKEG